MTPAALVASQTVPCSTEVVIFKYGDLGYMSSTRTFWPETGALLFRSYKGSALFHGEFVQVFEKESSTKLDVCLDILGSA